MYTVLCMNNLCFIKILLQEYYVLTFKISIWYLFLTQTSLYGAGFETNNENFYKIKKINKLFMFYFRQILFDFNLLTNNKNININILTS